MVSSWLEGPDPFDFDVIEIMNRASIDLWFEVRSDWFALMNSGRFPTGTGNSDTHSLQVEWVGFPINLVDVGENHQRTFVEAVQQGKVVVSNGPIVSMSVTNQSQETAGPGELLNSQGSVVVTATVRAASWVPVDELRFIVNGEVVQTNAIEESQQVNRGEWSMELSTERDSWVLVEAGNALDDLSIDNGSLYSLLAPSHVPIGFSNPVRLDHNGDGVWTR